ncbi:low temperature requirement protein LtrA [Leptotrichia wadei]|uniref:Low temperature requirement protein LtrA n=1 Tax=Leptotrichia wadei TaxID=157687 RepID=A0A510KCD6_9FUSO|nr:low temperature requirement protein LtrA [Leptotrichia wadei]
MILFYILGYIGFYLTLFVNEIYLEKKNRLNKKEYLKISATLMISFTLMIIVKENFFIV